MDTILSPSAFVKPLSENPPAKLYLHVCPECGCKFPSIQEKLTGTGVYGVLCADCWVSHQPRVTP